MAKVEQVDVGAAMTATVAVAVMLAVVILRFASLLDGPTLLSLQV